MTIRVDVARVVRVARAKAQPDEDGVIETVIPVAKYIGPLLVDRAELRVTLDGERSKVEILGGPTLPLVAQQAGFGAAFTTATCPGCGARRRVFAVEPGQALCVSACALDRLAGTRLERLSARLGRPGATELPPRPHGMRHQTYARLSADWQRERTKEIARAAGYAPPRPMRATTPDWRAKNTPPTSGG